MIRICPLRGGRVLGNQAPDFVRQPLQPFSCIRQLGSGERRRMIREVSRELDQLVEQLAQSDVLTTVALRLRH